MKPIRVLFDPLLADVAGTSIDPCAAATLLRQLFPGVACRTSVCRGSTCALQRSNLRTETECSNACITTMWSLPVARKATSAVQAPRFRRDW
jgi:hypothetical protein